MAADVGGEAHSRRRPRIQTENQILSLLFGKGREVGDGFFLLSPSLQTAKLREEGDRFLSFPKSFFLFLEGKKGEGVCFFISFFRDWGKKKFCGVVKNPAPLPRVFTSLVWYMACFAGRITDDFTSHQKKESEKRNGHCKKNRNSSDSLFYIICRHVVFSFTSHACIPCR